MFNVDSVSESILLGCACIFDFANVSQFIHLAILTDYSTRGWMWSSSQLSALASYSADVE